MRTAEERFRRAFGGAPMGMAIVAATPAALGQLLDVNKAMCDLTGYDRDHLLMMNLGSLTHRASSKDSVDGLSAHARGTEDRPFAAPQRSTRSPLRTATAAIGVRTDQALDAHAGRVRGGTPLLGAPPTSRRAGRPCTIGSLPALDEDRFAPPFQPVMNLHSIELR